MLTFKRRNQRKPTPLDPRTHPPLPAYLSPDMRVLFCGINPGQTSARSGHHFAHPTNQFWSLISQSRLTPENTRLTYTDDASCLGRFGFGLTNIAGRPSVQASHLDISEYRRGAERFLRDVVLAYRPRFVCFVGRGIYTHFYKALQTVENLQYEQVGSVSGDGLKGWISVDEKDGPETETRIGVFVIPSTSGRCRVGRDVKLDLLNDLADLMGSIGSILGNHSRPRPY